MFTISVRRAALAGFALVFSHAALAAPTIPPAVGHYEANNARWALAPGSFAGRGEALHFSPQSHTADQNYMGVSFFPEQALQIGQLAQLKVDLYIPQGQTCLTTTKEATVTIVLMEAGSPKYIYGELRNPAGACAVGAWNKLEFIDADWYAGDIGGGKGTLAAADAAAKARLGDGYQIDRIRITYTPATNTEAWFDFVSINSLPMAERINDLSPNALLPDQQTPGLVTSTLGYFQTKNIRWSVVPGFALHGEAMHFSPWSHDATANYAATSFFPQTALTVRDLTTLGIAMYLPAGSSCGTGERLGPYMWLVLSDAAGTKAIDAFVYRTDMSAICATKDKWQQLDFVNSANVRWNLRAASGTTVNLDGLSREGAHGTAVTKLGLGYKIDVVRMNFAGGAGGGHAWFDQKNVNGLQLLERAQDFTSDALLPDVEAFPHGTVPYGP